MNNFLAILGGNELAVPALERLRDQDYRLLVIDGNPHAPGKAACDQFLNINFTDVIALRESLKGIEFCGILPINDFGVRPASIIAAERGLPGNSIQTSIAVTNKAQMRKAWEAAGLPQPKYCVFSVSGTERGERPDWHLYPCIIKPAFSGGGSRGVGIVKSWKDAISWVRGNRAAFIDDQALLEEYILGSEHTAEVLIWPQGMRLLSISDKENYKGSIAVVQNLYFPGPIGHRYREQIESLLFAACHALGMTTGAAHFEVLIREDKIFLLEVGGRPGGGINLHPICWLSTGYDYPALYAAIMSGALPNFERANSYNLAWHYFDHGKGVLKAIHGTETLSQDTAVVDWKIHEKIGEQTFDKRNDLVRPGYVLTIADTHENAKRKALELAARVHFEIE